MEIRELYRDEVAGLAQIGTEALGVRFPSPGELRGLRENPRAFLPVAVAGTEIVGIARAEVRADRPKRVGTVRLVTSFVGEGMVDRAVRLALLSRLEGKFKDLGVDEIEVPGNQDPDFPGALERAGYRFDTPCAAPTLPRLVKPLRSDLPPWTQRAAPSPAPPGVVQ